jgi:phosphoenolpyruvate-protein kinase (PTS system EI component)
MLQGGFTSSRTRVQVGGCASAGSKVALPRPERRPELRRFTNRTTPVLAVLAIAAGPAILAGCGSSTSNSINNQVSHAKEEANKALEQGQKQLNKATNQGQKTLKEVQNKGNAAINQAQKSLHGNKVSKEAEKKLNEAKGTANEAIEKAREQLKQSGG